MNLIIYGIVIKKLYVISRKHYQIKIIRLTFHMTANMANKNIYLIYNKMNYLDQI